MSCKLEIVVIFLRIISNKYIGSFEIYIYLYQKENYSALLILLF